jgi:hypothetical protein
VVDVLVEVHQIEVTAMLLHSRVAVPVLGHDLVISIPEPASGWGHGRPLQVLATIRGAEAI